MTLCWPLVVASRFMWTADKVERTVACKRHIMSYGICETYKL